MYALISVCMTLALGLYVLAFYLSKRFWKLHIFSAITGFLLDMYATYLMETMRIEKELTFSEDSLILMFHTTIAVIAIFAFLLQAGLGIAKKKRIHVITAKYFFLPVWVVAYGSGLYLLMKFF